MPRPAATKPSKTNEVIKAHREALLGASPYLAERVASAMCARWYTSAPPLQLERAGMAAHPLGEWPNMPPLRTLLQHVDELDDPDAALSLARVLRAMFDWPEEVEQVSGELEQRLLARGAFAPEWSTQLDAWTLQSAHEVCEPGHVGELRARERSILAFEHPCGDRHGLCVTIDHRNGSHFHSIHAFDDIDAYLADERRAIARRTLPRPTLEPIDQLTRSLRMGRAIKKTYMHEFEPLRFDREGIDLFALTMCRSDCIPYEA